jgi:hypothetical protein
MPSDVRTALCCCCTIEPISPCPTHTHTRGARCVTVFLLLRLQAVALGRVISDRQSAAAARGEESADTPIDRSTTAAKYEELIYASLVRRIGLLELVAGSAPPWRPTDADAPLPLNAEERSLSYPAQVPALGEWVTRSGGCAYRIVPEVAEALRSRLDVPRSSVGISAATGTTTATSTAAGEAGPAWDALDALFALCGTWTAEAAQDSSGPARATIIGLVPHLSHVLLALWRAKPRPANKLLVQELAMTMYSAAVVEAAARANMTEGMEWCKRALEVWEEARGRDRARSDDFWIMVTFHLGNQHLLLKNGDEGARVACVHPACLVMSSPWHVCARAHKLSVCERQRCRYAPCERLQ